MNLGNMKKYTIKQKISTLKHLNEGRVFDVDENTDLKTSEVSNVIPKGAKIEKDDKLSFEDYKKLYNDVITQKCVEDYGIDTDKQLWEDTAKEMFLKSKEYIPTEEDKTQGTLDKKEENKKVESNDLQYKCIACGTTDLNGCYGLTTEKDSKAYNVCKDCAKKYSISELDKMADNINTKKTESVTSDYTLSEIKKVIDSNGDDFTIKIVNANEDVETKTLNIDRENLIDIYNTLGGNKVTEDYKKSNVMSIEEIQNNFKKYCNDTNKDIQDKNAREEYAQLTVKDYVQYNGLKALGILMQNLEQALDINLD